jgi:hypothetical protein
MEFPHEQFNNLCSDVGYIKGVVSKIPCAKHTADIELNTAFRNKALGIIVLIPTLISFLGVVAMLKFGS